LDHHLVRGRAGDAGRTKLVFEALDPLPQFLLGCRVLGARLLVEVQDHLVRRTEERLDEEPEGSHVVPALFPTTEDLTEPGGGVAVGGCAGEPGQDRVCAVEVDGDDASLLALALSMAVRHVRDAGPHARRCLGRDVEHAIVVVAAGGDGRVEVRDDGRELRRPASRCAWSPPPG
jgi:hypothetical protein